MRIGSHIALQIAGLVLTGAGVSLVLTHQTSTALEARERVEGDAQQLEVFERFADVTGHLLVTGDLVLGGGTTYLAPVAERQATTLQEILDELESSPLLAGGRERYATLTEHVAGLAELVLRAQHVEEEDRDAVLYSMLEAFDEISNEVTGTIDELRFVLAEAARERRSEAEAMVASARYRSRLAMLVFLLMILLSWRYLIRATGRPIRQLARRARAARDGGRFDPPGGGPAEVRELSLGFAELVSGLEEARDGLEETVAERTAALEGALQARAAFVANTSHELRTPMNAILGFADLMAQGDNNPADFPDYVDSIRSSGRHLLALIEDVLDLSKIDAGRMTVESIPLSPASLLEEVESMLAGAAADEGLFLRIRAPDEVPDHLLGDPTRLRQILVNLTSNAIKFTPEGSVDVTVGWSDGRLWAEVTDTGIGIPEDKLETIFEDFAQADVSATRRFGGTGLGLAISRRLARLMRGDITVRSEVGVGTTFRLDVDAAVTEETEDARRPAPVVGDERPRPVAGARILLVDDVATNRLLGKKMLQRMGAEVVEANDGRDAIDRFQRASDEGRPFDAILMDLQMPVMDGYEATRLLREDGFTGPILALSAAVLQEQQAEARASGCDGFVAKPIDAAELEQTLGELIERRRAAHTGRACA